MFFGTRIEYNVGIKQIIIEYLYMISFQNILFSVLLVLGVCSGEAQKTWSLEDCINYAIDHNLALKEFTYTQHENTETYRQSIRNLLPSINGYTDYNIQYGRSIDPNNNAIINTDFFSNNFALTAEMDLFRGFQKVNTIRASKFLKKAAQEEATHQKYLLAFRVLSAFYDIQFMEGLLSISKEQEEVSASNLALVKKQVELGQKAKADLYDAQAILISDQLVVTQNQNNVEAAKLKLIQEMNLEEANTINIQPVLFEKLRDNTDNTDDKDAIFTSAKNNIPLIKAQEWRTKAAETSINVSRGNLYPLLSLYGGYQTGFFETNQNQNTGEVIPFNTQIKDNAAQYVGVSLSIPISAAWSNRSEIKQKKIALLKAENNYNIQKQELYELIQQLVQERKALYNEYEQSVQKLEAQQLAFDIARKRYEKGLISAVELNQSKNTFASTQNENLQVQMRLTVNERTLDFYRGLPIFNI